MKRSQRPKNKKKNRSSFCAYEQFEPRLLLSATGELSGAQQSEILDHIASAPETAYLQFGASTLEFVAVENDHEGTTSLLQQNVNNIPIRNAYISVVQDADGNIEGVYDRGHVDLRLSSDRPGVGSFAAGHVANDFQSNATTSSELTWYLQDKEARLAWEVFSFVDATEAGDQSDADFYTIVDAHTGEILEQDTPGTVVEDLMRVPETLVGVHPRIVINNGIGAAGSRAYAAPFDAIVEIGGCTGTLIDSNTVLTARHCGVGPGTQVRFGDNSNGPVLFRTVSSASNPGGGNFNSPLLNGGDVTIANLSQTVPTSVATPMRLIAETSSLVGQIGGLHGYGFNGLGSNGHGFTSDGFRWGGENIIDRYGSPAAAGGSNIFSTDFDNGSSSNNTIGGSSPTPLQFEATTAPGDSGGPLLVEVNGEWLIAGVLSGGTTSTSVYGDISWWTGIAPFQAQIEAAGGQFGNSEFSGTVGPDSLNLVRGEQISGNESSLQTSNNVDLVLDPDNQPADNAPPIQFELQGNLPLDNPSQLEFRIESAANTANLLQLVEGFNYLLNQYQVLSFEEPAYVNDGVVDFNLNSQQFVDAGTGDVAVRVTYLVNGPIFFPNWTVNVDQAAWVVNGGTSPSGLTLPGDDSGDDNPLTTDRSLDLSDRVSTTQSSLVKDRARFNDLSRKEIAETKTPVNALFEDRQLIDKNDLADRVFDSNDLGGVLDEFDSVEIEINVRTLDWFPARRI